MPYGTYTVTAMRDGYDFTGGDLTVTVPNDGRPQDDIEGMTDDANANLSALHLSGVTLKYVADGYGEVRVQSRRGANTRPQSATLSR